jgi:hypothetical protein
MTMQKNKQLVRSFIRSFDFGLVLIVLLIAVSTGHVGRLFADREDVRQAFVGYVLAVSLDGVLAFALYRTANVRQRAHRSFALSIFLFACAVSGGFNVWYYRQNYAQDPLWLSVLLGITAPVLAALVSVLRAHANAERTEAEQTEREAERTLELEKYTIEQAEQTRREHLIAQERTKQIRAQARAEKAKANALAQTKRTVKPRTNGRRAAGELDEAARLILLEFPDIGPRPLARELGCSPSTASGILERVRSNGDSQK